MIFFWQLYSGKVSNFDLEGDPFVNRKFLPRYFFLALIKGLENRWWIKKNSLMKADTKKKRKNRFYIYPKYISPCVKFINVAKVVE